MVSGGEQTHFEFMTKICNYSRLFDDPGSVVPNVAPALQIVNHNAKCFFES